jgi:hypothetical protein
LLISFWFLCLSAGVLPKLYPSIDTNPQNNTSKADNEIYAQNYGDDFKDYVEFASENYGDGNLADTNNNNSHQSLGRKLL